MKCNQCNAEIPDTSRFCPECGKPKQAMNPAAGSVPSTDLAPNIAGMLAYITFIPAVIFLLIEPYNKNSFVRFHAFQSIFLNIAAIVIQIGLHILGNFLSIFVLAFLPVYGLVGLAFFILWIICLVKALNNEKFKIPIIGDLADQQAGK